MIPIERVQVLISHFLESGKETKEKENLTILSS